MIIIMNIITTVTFNNDNTIHITMVTLNITDKDN